MIELGYLSIQNSWW